MNQKVNAMLIVGVIVVAIVLTIGCVDNEEKEKMNEIKTVVVFVNTNDDYSQYGALGAAFDLKANKKIENVIVFYGPSGIDVTTKGSLAEYKLTPTIKQILVNQYPDVLTVEMLPDNLEQLARFLNRELGVNFYSCATFNMAMEEVTTIDELKDIEDFITPLKISDALDAGLNADKVIWL